MKGFYSSEQLAAISLFTRVVKLEPIDCFSSEKRFLFVVPEGKAGLAVGKQGVNIKKLERMTSKRIKVIEYSSDACQFVSNLIFPMKAKKIDLKDDVVKVHPEDSQMKAKLIGRDRRNLNFLNEIFHKYFEEKVEIA